MSERPLVRISFAPPAELTELGRSARRLVDRMLAIDEESPGVRDALAEARNALEAAAAKLAPHLCRAPGLRVGPQNPGPHARRYYVQGPTIGPHHPLEMPLEVHHADGRTSGRVHFSLAYEGPPGCVHGGFIAHFFDQLLGAHNLALDVPAMTGTLKVRYRRPVPLERELTCEARSEPLSGRKLSNSATLSDADGVLAEAEGLFVLPRALPAQYTRTP